MVRFTWVLKNIKGLNRDFAYWIIENRPFLVLKIFNQNTRKVSEN